MNEKLIKTIDYIVKQGIETIKNNCDGLELKIDYLAIFCKNDEELNLFEKEILAIGDEVEKEKNKTGKTFLLRNPIKTDAGLLYGLKIRKPDLTRPQRGAPDFKADNYDIFKEKFLTSTGNFSLIVKKDFEMIEIKGIDVLVYIPIQTFDERVKK